MRAVMILLALSIAACDMCVGGASDDIPVTLAGAAPADILLYLYDVVLTPHMLTDTNTEGGTIPSPQCPGGMPRTKSGQCPPHKIPITNLFKLFGK
ncbi:hypothetical protein B5X24_HaOG210245 [Helicoverpa armigera]|nr:hypothetical protein B5X24_HaOG210245 [Helicoverpa armigera]